MMLAICVLSVFEFVHTTQILRSDVLIAKDVH